jgi:predicted outer membrane protein
MRTKSFQLAILVVLSVAACALAGAAGAAPPEATVTITGVTPTTAIPGQLITITGTNLENAQAVTFGTTTASPWSVDAAGSWLKIDVPSGVPQGPATIALTVNGTQVTGGPITIGSGSMPAQALPQATGKASGSGSTNTTGTASAKDRAFVVAAGHAGAAEIAAGKLALTKSTQQSTRAFARKMIHDHTVLAAKLRSVAATVGLVPPATPTPAQAATLHALARLSGSAFDSAYRKSQVASHEAAVALFTSEGSTGQTPTLKSAASAALPTIEMHLRMAQALQT